MDIKELAVELAIKHGLGIHDPRGTAKTRYQRIEFDTNYMNALLEGMNKFAAEQLEEAANVHENNRLDWSAQWLRARAAKLRKASQ